ncbi:LysM peptidoglycan-binding domain-containing M23 family metallopeptidase [Streptomyces sp. CBMA152]|uniref:M23 family metallopeptidase n=1 Tax=Streptomyces sp. CBMA152 TaxID=1896312 RepID=UPI001660CA8D|nr:LysM peptidoglycan-binding domain-containing M23 family metallopeptidase [Streptomyces sp. CBMA152]MBD0747883.1 peptidase [Streptomyces sp. CBMA152]
MPAKGKHRRPKSSPISRGMVAAGTGGAALAIPLLGATGAHAAVKSAAPAVAPQQAARAAAAFVAAPTAAPQAAPTTYKVKSGDCLSKIAEDHRLDGWKKLYQDNRSVVGDDPALIRPGMKLTIGAKSHATASHTSTATSHASSAAPATTTSAAKVSQGSASGFRAPLDSVSIGTPYRMAGSMWSSGYHTGVDFEAQTGTTVKAVGAGTVVTAGWGGAYGNQVVIRHADGMYSQYAHLSQLSVSAGQTVTEGQEIGLSGATGNVTGPHLHFEIRTTPDYGSDVDPLAYLRQQGASL